MSFEIFDQPCEDGKIFQNWHFDFEEAKVTGVGCHKIFLVLFPQQKSYDLAYVCHLYHFIESCDMDLNKKVNKPVYHMVPV